jgi:hypothetical protein
MGAKKKSKGESKAEFVRRQPAELPGPEVVAKAKEAGLTLTMDYVHKVRSEDRKASKRAKAPAKKKAAAPAKSSAPRKAASDSAEKAKFVASFSAETPATTIAAEARKKGLTMSEKFIYNLRRKGKAAPAPKPPAAAARRRRAKASKPNGAPAARMPAASSASYEAVFAKAVVDMGFDQAQAVLTRVRDRLLRAAAG